MRVLIQRVAQAHVSVDSTTIASTGAGLLLFVGINHHDDQEKADYLVSKIANLRIFEDEKGKMHFSALDTNAEILAVSQFTLYGAVDRGRRPSFEEAAKGELALPLFDYFVKKLKSTGLSVETGEFGADMQVSLTNDGPVTFLIEK